MKRAALLMIAAVAAVAADSKSPPNQAGNDRVNLNGTALVDRKEIGQALGEDLGDGYIVVRLKVTPAASRSLLVSRDDFTLISRKDGERSGALAPSQIAGTGPVIVDTGGGGFSPAPRFGAEKEDAGDPSKQTALLQVLKSKGLPQGEAKSPVEGLLYFAMDGKVKPKDLSLLYKGAGGRLEIDFK
jgi:hypothetical protein